MLNEIVPGCFATFYEGEVLDEKRLENWMKEERGSLTGEEGQLCGCVRRADVNELENVRVRIRERLHTHPSLALSNTNTFNSNSPQSR